MHVCKTCFNRRNHYYLHLLQYYCRYIYIHGSYYDPRQLRLGLYFIQRKRVIRMTGESCVHVWNMVTASINSTLVVEVNILHFEKLSIENYEMWRLQMWRLQMRSVLVYHGLWGYVTKKTLDKPML